MSLKCKRGSYLEHLKYWKTDESLSCTLLRSLLAQTHWLVQRMTAAPPQNVTHCPSGLKRLASPLTNPDLNMPLIMIMFNMRKLVTEIACQMRYQNEVLSFCSFTSANPYQVLWTPQPPLHPLTEVWSTTDKNYKSSEQEKISLWVRKVSQSYSYRSVVDFSLFSLSSLLLVFLHHMRHVCADIERCSGAWRSPWRLNSTSRFWRP